MIGLLETKLNESALDTIIQRGFSGMGMAHNFHFCDRGRILLLWDSQLVDLEILMATDQLIHCRLRCIVTGKRVLVTFVYGLHSIVTRRPLWRSLAELGEDITEAWMIMGDFNAILSVHDKVGGQPVSNYELQDLEQLVQGCGLVDLESIGCRLTWTNGMVSCKFNRALVNSHWLMADLNGYVEFLPPGCLSDHSCCMVSLLECEPRVQRRFLFYNITCGPCMMGTKNWLRTHGRNRFLARINLFSKANWSD